MSPKDPKFTCDEVYTTLLAAKTLAADKIKANRNYRWYEGVLHFDLEHVTRANDKGGRTANIYITVSGIKGPLKMLFKNEIHKGWVNPNTDSEVARLQVLFPKFKIEKRTMGVTLNFQKWKSPPETEEDRITIKKSADGNPILPPDSDLSMFYMANELISEAFVLEIRWRKTNNMIVSEDDVSSGDVVPGPTAIKVLSTRIVPIVQTMISTRAKENPGMPLPNPIVRSEIMFDQTTGETKTEIYDSDKAYIDDNDDKAFDLATVEGKPINANNIHMFITSGSENTGTMHRYVAFSNMGISAPGKVDVVVVKRRVRAKDTLADAFGGDMKATAEELATLPRRGAGRPKVQNDPVAVSGTADSASGSGDTADEYGPVPDYDELVNSL